MTYDEYFNNASEEEQEFLQTYCSDGYRKPSVTADIAVFTVNPDGNLCLLLIQRKDFPYKDHWALPGGFLQAEHESVGETAVRELKEETGLSGLFLQQLKTYSDPERDPRMHVISVAHFALVPYTVLKPMISAGDDAKRAELFVIRKTHIGIQEMNSLEDYIFANENQTLLPIHLAFDHYQIISDAIERLHGRAKYCFDLFALLKDDQSFTISEFQKIYDAINFKDSDPANFRKMFNSRYVKSGIVQATNEKNERGAELYCYKGMEED